MTPYGDINLGQNLLECNGLLPGGTKLLPEPTLTYHQRCSTILSPFANNWIKGQELLQFEILDKQTPFVARAGNTRVLQCL